MTLNYVIFIYIEKIIFLTQFVSSLITSHGYI